MLLTVQRSLRVLLRVISTVRALLDCTQSPKYTDTLSDNLVCPTSLSAIQGALATVCEAVDSVVDNSRQEPIDGLHRLSRSSFVAVRPPGHHCGEDTPSGFCFVNNVLVGAAHAHLRHGIKRVVIFDIDLHHGNTEYFCVKAIDLHAA